MTQWSAGKASEDKCAFVDPVAPRVYLVGGPVFCFVLFKDGKEVNTYSRTVSTYRLNAPLTTRAARLEYAWQLAERENALVFVYAPTMDPPFAPQYLNDTPMTFEEEFHASRSIRLCVFRLTQIHIHSEDSR